MKLYYINLYREQKLKRMGRAPSAVSLGRDQKRFVASASLASVLVLVTLANGSLLSRSPAHSMGSQGRGIASLEADPMVEATAMTSGGWLTSYVRSHKETEPTRSVASLSSTPTEIDQLRFGLLEGKYAIRTSAGQVRELEFIDTDASSDRPKYITDKQAFLKSIAKLHRIDFSQMSEADVTEDGAFKKESYTLLASDGKIVGKASFTVDEYGRMRALHLEEQK